MCDAGMTPEMSAMIRKLVEKNMIQEVHCFPGFNIHEHCEHVRPKPTFENIGNYSAR